jgi:hypothetical protein
MGYPWLEDRQTDERYYGKYPGLVCKNTAPENDEDKVHTGELLVEVPGILEESENGTSEQPIVVLAKPCFHPGYFFIPEVGAQVWVEFIAGDVNSPVWTGVWYPVKETPKTVTDEAPTEYQKIIRTASGHVIELDDTAEKEKIVIRHTHKDGARIQIDENGSVLIANEKGSFVFLNADGEEATFMDQHGNLVALTANGIALVNKDSTIVEMKGGKVTVIASDQAHVTAKDVVLDSATVTLGKGATEPVVLGQTFATLWNQFIFHTHATAVGPSGTPLPPVTPLIAAPGQGLSTAVKAK